MEKIIFLSASFPRRERDKTFYQTADPEEITQALTALSNEAFKTGWQLLFGGHPSVSTLVLSCASHACSPAERETPIANQEKLPVVVYQSEAFGDAHYSKMFQDCLNCVWIKARGETARFTTSHTLIPASVRNSLKAMRRKMLAESNPTAGVFIGGMEGIIQEAELFLDLFPGRPAFFIGAPGGASLECAHRFDSGTENKVPRSELMKARNYRMLMKNILGAVQN